VQRAAAIRPREEDTTMLTLLRNPDPAFATLSAEVNRLMNDLTQPGARGYGLAPAADILENEAGFQVVLDVPGLDPAAIKLDIENDTLTVQADRKQPALADGATLHRGERRFGTFFRAFTLPKTVDGAKVEARYDAGVLTVTLPKREDAKPRTIAVQVK
jgi:HSP20 family protein